jgi:TPP-dependent pyruvate/acetoin dehydrogenase alpha subunit
VRIRAFECAPLAGNIHGMMHSAVGQEAVAVSVYANLRRDDLVTGTPPSGSNHQAKSIDCD